MTNLEKYLSGEKLTEGEMIDLAPVTMAGMDIYQTEHMKIEIRFRHIGGSIDWIMFTDEEVINANTEDVFDYSDLSDLPF